MSVTRTESDSDFDEQTVSRAAPGKNKNRLIENQSKDASSSDTVSHNTESMNAEKLCDIVTSELQALNVGAPNPASQSNNKPPQFRPGIFEQQGYIPYNNSNQGNAQTYQGRPPRGPCYLCGEFTHYKARCPLNKAQLQHAQVTNSNGSNNNNDPRRKGIPSSDTIYVSGSINGVKVNFVMDTGAEKTIVSKKGFDKIYQYDQPKLVKRGKLMPSGGQAMTVYGRCKVNIVLDQVKLHNEVVIAELNDEVLLGMDILTGMDGKPADIILSQNKIILNGQEINYQH